MEERKRYIDVAKGIGIAIVVFFHININSTIDSFFGVFQMPLFFILSGMLFKERSNIDIIKRKAKSLLVPYFFYGILTFLYGIIIEFRIRGLNTNNKDVIVGLLTGDPRRIEYNEPLWFLPSMFLVVIVYYFLFNTLLKLVNKMKLLNDSVCFNEKKKTQLYLVIIAFISYIYLNNDIYYYNIIDFPKYFLYYSIGVLISSYKISILKEKNIIIKMIGGFFLSGSILYVLATFANVKEKITLLLCALLLSSIILLCSIVFEKSVILSICGKNSLRIMCLHGCVYRVFVKIFSIILHIDVNDVRSSIAISILLSLITITIIILFCKMLNDLILFIESKGHMHHR